MPRIDLSQQAQKFLTSVPEKHARLIAGHLLSVGEQPEAAHSTELKGYPLFRRMKSGEYRIIYAVDSDAVFITLISERNDDDDIYKQLKRLLK